MQGLELAGEGSLPWHDQVKERMSIDTEPFVRFAGISTLFISAEEGSGQEFVAALEPLTKHDSNLVSWKASETIYMLEKGLTLVPMNVIAVCIFVWHTLSLQAGIP